MVAGLRNQFSSVLKNQLYPWTVTTENPDDIGVAQFDGFDHTPEAQITLRQINYFPLASYIGVEEGAPKVRGALLVFNAQGNPLCGQERSWK
jgi:hypothetical protein